MTRDFFSAWDKPETQRQPATVHVIDTTNDRYSTAALEREATLVATAANGTRNHALNKAAFNLSQLVAAGNLNHDDVHQTLTDAARQAGLDPSEIEATLRSGLTAGATKPRTVPAATPAHDVPPVTILDDHGHPTPDTTQALAIWVTERLPRVDWHELWTREDTEEWIIEPLLPARRLVALYSAPKVGKSLLMLELAVAIARGTEALGSTPDRPRRVLYIDFENDLQADIRERLTDMAVKPTQLDMLDYLSFPTIAGLDSERGAQELMAAITHYQSEVVVIDTVSRSVQGDENENDTWLDFYRHTGIKLKQAGVALIRLDHSGKDETKGQRGGSAKVGDVDAVWRMSRVNDDTFQLDCEANRMPVTEKTLVLHRLAGPLRHHVDSAGRTAVWDIKIAAIIAAADGAGLDRDAGSTKVRDAARAVGVRASNKVIAEAIKRRKLSVPALTDRYENQTGPRTLGTDDGPVTR